MVSCWCPRDCGGRFNRCFCPKSSKRYLYVMNTIVFLAGLSIMIASLVLSIQSGDLIAGLSSVGLIGPAIAGGVLLAVSLLGCAGVAYRNRCLLGIYFLLIFTMSAFVIAAGVVLTFFIDDVNNVIGEASADLTDFVEGQINDYIVAVFNECCADQQAGLVRLEDCAVATPGDACFTFVGTYQDALDRVRNSGLCTVFENTQININGIDVPIVGDAGDGGCAGGDGNLFVQEFSKLVQELVQPVGGAVLGIGVLLFITAVASVCLICQDRESYEYRVSEEKARRNDAKDFERGIAPRQPRKPKQAPNDSRYGESIAGMDSANPRYKNYDYY